MDYKFIFRINKVIQGKTNELYFPINRFRRWLQQPFWTGLSYQKMILEIVSRFFSITVLCTNVHLSLYSYYCGNCESIQPGLVWEGWHWQTDKVQTHHKYHTGQGKAWWNNVSFWVQCIWRMFKEVGNCCFPSKNSSSSFFFFPLMMVFKPTFFFPSSLLLVCMGPWAHGSFRSCSLLQSYSLEFLQFEVLIG